MAPKKAPHSPSSSQEASTKKTKKLSHSPTSYSSQDIKKRASLFSKRTLAPSKFMHEDTLKAIGCFDEVQNLLLVSGLFQFSFNTPHSLLSFFHLSPLDLSTMIMTILTSQ